MLLQGFYANPVWIPQSKIATSGNKENVNHTNLGNRNATIIIYRNHFWEKETLLS